MPPKAKFSKNEIIIAAIEVVKREGFDALTARSLAAELGSSPRPIFTVFDSMDEVQREVEEYARRIYENYEDEEMKELAFKGSGIGYIRFAMEQPRLFQLLFMKEKQSVPDIENVLAGIDGYYEKILSSVQTSYGFSRETAKEIYIHMWIYSHGIASLLATNVCSFTAEQISDMLTDVCAGIIRKYKADGKK